MPKAPEFRLVTESRFTTYLAAASTTVGNALRTAVDAAAARTAIGALAATDKGATNGVAPLVGGLLPTTHLPALALTTAVPVASEAAMLALTSTQVQPGDLAVRTDGAGTFILTAATPSVLASWTRLNAPTDLVSSVNGQTGTVVLSAAQIGTLTTAEIQASLSTRMRWVGAWSASTAYSAEDVVSYLDGVYRAGTGTIVGTAPVTGNGTVATNWTRLSYAAPDLSPFVLKTDPIFTAQVFQDVTAHYALNADTAGKTVRVDMTGTTPVWVVIPHATNTVVHTPSGITVPPWNPPVGTVIPVTQRNTAPVSLGAVTGVGLISPPVDAVDATHTKRVPGRYSIVLLEKDNSNNWIVRNAVGVAP